MTKKKDLAFIALDPDGMNLCRKIQPHFSGSLVHGRIKRLPESDVPFSDVVTHLQTLYSSGIPVVGVCATGILVRAIAPILAKKTEEPPVIALSHDGKTVVPVLGGHHGANRLARDIAVLLGGQAAITTAADLSCGLALDNPPDGWKVGNPQTIKGLTTALLFGESVRLVVEAGNVDWLMNSSVALADTAPYSILCTDKNVQGSNKNLVLHPPTLALGVGCTRGCAPEELANLVHHALCIAELSVQSIAGVFSLDLKMNEPAIQNLAQNLGIPARFFRAWELECEKTRLIHPSTVAFKEVGCHGVAEGAALAAVGVAGHLIVEKQKSAHATCAIARRNTGIEAMQIGIERGRLNIVGIGPGRMKWRTFGASQAIAQSSDVVGYTLYLDLLGEALTGKIRHETPITAEKARVVLALDLASEGRTVALVCSGDAGIYALAALVFELIERENKPQWNQLDITIEPGVSAIQAAAARAGAPINHDFCIISLSDLLTPWEDIERRLRAAGEGDFVVGLYNPASTRRRFQIERARDILSECRAPNTPVILARNLGRKDESLRIINLENLSASDADMLTLIIIGSTNTRFLNDRIYTPRGYTRKMENRE